MTVIIRGRKRPYGVLGAHTTSLRGFATDEVDFLRTVSNVLADAIHRKNAEEELRQSEARFRRVVESNILGIIYWDASGAITGANDAFLKMVGYTREELIGGRMRWTDMTPRKYRKLDKRAFGDLATSGICETYEKEYIRKDGSRVAVLLGCAILEGEKQGGVGFVLDITERKQTENALRESNEKFHQLADNITDAFWIRSPDFREVHYISPAFERIWGCTVESLYANPQQWVDFILPEDRDRVLAVFETLTEASPSVSIEYQIARPDGEIRWIDVRGFQVRDAAGELIRLTGIVTDVTEQVLSRRRLKETEEQLRQSQKLESVGMLAGGIAHDFNNLLTVITGYSDLTLGRLDRADPLARNVEAIKKAAERATSLTSQLLAFSRKQMLQPKVLDLNSVIVNIEKMLGLLVGEHMELCTSRGVGLGRVKADPGQIEQVILNLVVNARDAMPKGGKITLETANIYLDEAYVRRHIAVQPGWYAMLAVTDTGHGMDADTQKNIFEPFFTTKEQGKGTGLGLSTVYGIVKQSGGNIWVYSEVGLGTTFKIYLPLVDEQVTEPEADAARLESAAGTETILLAEDEELVRKLATESLKMHGYTVLEAANGGEALRISQQHDGPIHLLLTDMVMPRMGGKELADQLLGLRPDMRVLYMSGYTEQAIVHHGILDVDIAFIGKPFTPDALVLKVIEVLNANSKVLTVA
jgi:PAS domain S-box-containing protein